MWHNELDARLLKRFLLAVFIMRGIVVASKGFSDRQYQFHSIDEAGFFG